MALAIKDRVKELTTTTGTGTLTLVSAPTGFRRFSSALSDGDSTYYTIESGANWEVGVGVYSANTLTRATVLASSNSNALINITAARSFVFIVYPADKATYKDGSGRIVSGAAGIIFSDNSVQTTAATTPDLSAYATLASPTFTGVPAAPTAAGGTNTTQIATTAFVTSAVGSIDLSPYLTISSAASTYLTQSSATTLLAAKADLVGGLIPSAQLPSYVDDVVEAANLAAFPGTGETGKIYVAIDTGYTYRWSGSVYVRINEVDLSSYLTSSTAASTYLPLVGGTLTGDLKFTDALYDIGKSGATRPRDGFFSRNLTVGSQLSVPYGDSTNPSILIGNTNTGIHGLNDGSRRIRFTVGGTLTAEYAAGAHIIDGSLFFGVLGSSPTVGLLSLESAVLEVRNRNANTTAQTLELNNTWTSTTSFEKLRIKANAGAAYQIGSAVGSAGGTNRAITFGHWNTAGTFVGTACITTAGTYGGRFSDNGGTSDGERFGADSQVLGDEALAAGRYAIAGSNYATAIGKSSYAGYFCTSLGRCAGTTGTSGGYPSAPGFNYCIVISDGTDFVPPTANAQLLIAGLWTEAYFGKKVTHATPLDVRFNATGGSGTNIAGASITIAGGKGTGTGVGGSVKIQVAPAGSSGASLNALVDVITVDSTKLSTFAGPIAASSIIRQSAEITSTPSGTTQTVTLNDGNHQTLTLTSSTGDVTATLTVPTSSSAGTLIINQHGTTPRDITWAVSSGTIKWMGTEPTWSSDAVNDVRIVSWRWDGSVMYLAATDVGT